MSDEDYRERRDGLLALVEIAADAGEPVPAGVEGGSILVRCGPIPDATYLGRKVAGVTVVLGPVVTPAGPRGSTPTGGSTPEGPPGT